MRKKALERVESIANALKTQKNIDNERPDNIAIIRKGFKKNSENDNSQKIDITCEKRDVAS